MDQLTKDAVAAAKLGISYGKYMAAKPRKPPAVRFVKREDKEDGEDTKATPEQDVPAETA